MAWVARGGRSIVVLCLILAVCAGGAFASSSQSAGGGGRPARWNVPPKVATAPYLVIETRSTTGTIQQTLNDRGITFTLFSGDDWTGLDLSAYNTVILGLDGGYISAASVQNVATFAQGGGCLIVFGGSGYQVWADAVNTYLVENNTANYNWVWSASPHLVVTDSGNPLAAGLPATYDYVTGGGIAAQYQIKPTDPAISVAADNGDGYPCLFSKPLGTGTLIWFTNTPYDADWTVASDYAVFSTILGNALDSCNPAPVPAMGPWGLGLLAALLAGVMLAGLRRRTAAPRGGSL